MLTKNCTVQRKMLSVYRTDAITCNYIWIGQQTGDIKCDYDVIPITQNSSLILERETRNKCKHTKHNSIKAKNKCGF